MLGGISKSAGSGAAGVSTSSTCTQGVRGPERFTLGVGGMSLSPLYEKSGTDDTDGLSLDNLVGVVNVGDGVFLLLGGIVVMLYHRAALIYRCPQCK